MLEVVRPIVLGTVAITMMTSCTARDPQATTIASEVEIDSRIGQQGRLLLGFKDPDLRTFAMPASVVAPTVTVDGQLVATGLAGTDFVGVAFTATAASGAIEMRIADVFAPDATTPRWQYALEQRDAAAQPWTPACAEPTPVLPLADPIPSPPRAVVIPGRFRGDGIYDLGGPLGVSFACQTGVIGKCVGWGFYPGQAWPTTTAHGFPSTASTFDMLAACTRMARFDYCGDSSSNTLDGTPIQIDDVFHVYTPMPGYAFEAAWRARGSVLIDPFNPGPPSMCLSKLRWSTLPLGGNCPPVLPDPRIDPKGRFCEDFTPEQLESKGAMLYSSSSYIDAGLYAHVDPGTGAALTTASLVPRRDHAQELPAWQIPAPANVPFPRTGQRHRLDAAIFSHRLPAGLSTSGLALLTSYACPAGDFVTSTRSPTGCTPIADEGYVYADPTAAHPALRTWWSPALQHSYTTTMPASTMIASGWQLVEVTGGVIRAELEVNVRWAAVAGATYSLDVLARDGTWVTPCLGAAQLDTSTSVRFTGLCVAADRTVPHADIVAFRITATNATGSATATAAYDGVAGDVYAELSGGTTTAIDVGWNAYRGAVRYAFWVQRIGGSFVECAGASFVGTERGFLYTGRCPGKVPPIAPSGLARLRACAVNKDGVSLACGEAAYDGVAPRVTISIR